MILLVAAVVVLVAAVWVLAWCLCRIAALSDLPHAESGGAPLPGSAFDDVEFVYSPWTPYDGKRRLP